MRNDDAKKLNFFSKIYSRYFRYFSIFCCSSDRSITAIKEKEVNSPFVLEIPTFDPTSLDVAATGVVTEHDIIIKAAEMLKNTFFM